MVTPAMTAAARARRLERDAAMDWLATTYPALFGDDMKPLALGVGKEIWPPAQAAGIGRKALNDAISRRVRAPLCLDALTAAGAMRFDLDGVAIEPVNEEHRVLATTMQTKWHVHTHQKSS